MVEEARLESVYTCQRVSRVRIPIPMQKSKTCDAQGCCRSKYPFGSYEFSFIEYVIQNQQYLTDFDAG